MNERDDLAQRADQIAAEAPSGWTHTGPWVCAQRWEQLLFLHWPVPTAVARALVPAEIEIDTHNGQAYVSVLALRMDKVHLRDMFPIPGLADFPELNVRTYVVHDGKPGVWFVSLDAPSHLNVWIGRHMFHLNYDVAHMRMTDTAGRIDFTCARERSRGRFAATYEPSGPASPAAPGSVEEFLAERYCMYTTDHEGELRRADIEHRPWVLQPVTLDVTENTVLQADGMPDLGPPAHAMYGDDLENVVWLPVRA